MKEYAGAFTKDFERRRRFPKALETFATWYRGWWPDREDTGSRSVDER